MNNCSGLIKLAVLIALLVSRLLWSQVAIHGKVYDKESGERLSAANIQIVDKMRGTITNTEGEFQLKVKALPVELRTSYIGYRSKTVKIEKPLPPKVNIALEPTVLELEEIVVSGENPANRIMRKVIEKKQKLYDVLKTFDAKAYTRIRIENDSGIVAIMESTSDLYWHWQKGVRERVNFKETTHNLAHIPGAVGASHIPNFYDDTIEIAGARPPGPTHPEALTYYRFTLEKQNLIDDSYVFEISVQPKHFLQPGFVGSLSVLDEKFVMLKVDLKPNQAVWPKFFILQNIDQHFQQQFNQFGKGIWLPVDFRSSMTVKLGMTGLDFPKMRFYQMVSLDEYHINIDLPDSLYADKAPQRLDSTAARMETGVDSLRAIPLTVREMDSYIAIDSSKTVQQAFKPRGFLSPLIEFETETSASDSAVSKKDARLSYRINPQLRFNRVDKFHLGMKAILEKKPWSLAGMLAYKNGPKRWSGGLDVSIHIKNALGVVLTYTDDSVPILPSPSYSGIFTALSSLAGFHDYHDYYWRRGYGFALQTGWGDGDFALTIGLHRHEQTSLEKTNDYDLFRQGITRVANPQIEEGIHTAFQLEVELGDRQTYTGIRGQKGFTLSLQKATPNFLQGDFDYTRLNVVLDWRFTTFLKRRFMPMVLDIRIAGGTHWGTLPAQMTSGVHGSLKLFTPFGVLRTWQNQPLYSNDYIGLFWEHDFRTVPFELIGIDWLVKRGTGIVVHAAHVKHRKFDFGGVEKMPYSHYHEYGFSINNILPFVRLDFMQRLNPRDLYFGIGLAKIL